MKKHEIQNNMRDFDEKDEKDPIRMFAWFTEENLNKRFYWICIIILLIIFTVPQIIKFFL